MKKVLCFALSMLLAFNTTVVYADFHGGSSGSFDVTPTPIPSIPSDMLDEGGRIKPPATLEFLDKILVAGLASNASKELASLLYGFIGDDFLKNYDNSDNSISIENGGSTVHFHDTFVDKFNKALQDKVHAFDGYYLVEPHGKSPAELAKDAELSDSETKKFLDYLSKNNYQTIINGISTGSTMYICPPNIYYYIVYNPNAYMGEYELHCYDKNHDSWDCKRYGFWFSGLNQFILEQYKPPFESHSRPDKLANMIVAGEYCYGLPLKVFYSKEALQNYFANNEKRTYAPKLPSGGFKVNLKYITNTTNLPDITYNITTENKTELEIQNQYDTTINNYLESLDDFSSGGDDKPVTPTPTPIISDGQPTPTPGFTDGSLTPTPPPTNVDLTDTNNWLEKIYNWLEEFGKSHDKFTKDLSDYLETHRGKLEDIIKALDKIADGMEKGEDDGCKYDYSELSDFMKELWNESDKKFDTMIDLLEENNEYQKKLVDTLDSIKSILKTQSIMDTFKNRSEETAKKAKEKFPTSVPWDIAVIINAMSAEPKAPVFECPIEIKSLNKKEYIEVDLSSGEWETLAKTCRYMLSLLFVLFMVQLSRRLFFNKGDDD